MVSVEDDFSSVYAHFVAFFILSQGAAIVKIGIKKPLLGGHGSVTEREHRACCSEDSSSLVTHNWIIEQAIDLRLSVSTSFSRIRIVSALQYAFKN